jgi:hypothetical protein
MLGAPPVAGLAAAAAAAATAALAAVRRREPLAAAAGAAPAGAAAGLDAAGGSWGAWWLLAHDLPLFLDPAARLPPDLPSGAAAAAAAAPPQRSPRQQQQRQAAGGQAAGGQAAGGQAEQADISLFEGDPPPRPMGLMQLQRIHIANDAGSAARFASRPVLQLSRAGAGQEGGGGGGGPVYRLSASEELVVPPGSTAVVSLPLVLAVPVPRQQGAQGEGVRAGGSGKWQLVPVVQTAAGRPFDAVLVRGSWLYPLDDGAAAAAAATAEGGRAA